MPIYLASIILLALLSINRSYAQTYSGKVVARQTGTGLRAASVVLADSSKKPVAFTRTKADGTFSIARPAGKEISLIRVTMLGYEPSETAAASFSNGGSIVMDESMTGLQAVEVRPKRMSQSGDTLTYKVSAFTHVQDRSIADVIARMPGMEVTDNGTIKFNGKSISTLYVENMDISGSKYALVSENVDASMVREVEVLRNHQAKRVLQDKEYSNEVAINLVLIEKAKAKWTARADVGAGMATQDAPGCDMLADVRLLAMMFGKGRQSINVVKYNNTGKNVADELRDMTGADVFSNTTSRPPVSEIKTTATGIDEARVAANSTTMAASNWLWKTGGEGQLRTHLSFLTDNTAGQQATVTTYHATDAEAVLSEDYEQSVWRREWEAEVRYEQNTSERYLTNTLRGHLDFNTGYAEGSTAAGARRQRVEPRSQYIADKVELTMPVGGSRTLKWSATAAYNHHPTRLLTAADTTQRIDSDDIMAETTLSLRQRIFGFWTSWDATASYYGARYSDGTAFLTRYSVAKGMVRPSASLPIRDGSISVAVPLTLVSMRLDGRGMTTFVVQPEVSLRYKLSGMSDIMAAYSAAYVPQTIGMVTSCPIYTSYNNITTGSGELEAQWRHMANVIYTVSNMSYGLSGSIMAFMSHNRGMTLYESHLDGIIYRREATGGHYSSTMLNLSLRGSKTFDWAKTTLSLAAGAASYSYRMMIGREALPYRMTTYTTEARLSMMPTPWLAVDGRTAMTSSRTGQKGGGDVSAVTQLSHRLGVNMTSGRWLLSLAGEIYHDNSEGSGVCSFADAGVEYRMRRLGLRLDITNIMGVRRYERTTIMPDKTLTAMTYVRPREMLLTASLSL